MEIEPILGTAAEEWNKHRIIHLILELELLLKKEAG